MGNAKPAFLVGQDGGRCLYCETFYLVGGQSTRAIQTVSQDQPMDITHDTD